MEVMGAATPKGLEEAGVGETPLLEMVLPGVTAIPGAGDEPGGQMWELGKMAKIAHRNNFLIFDGKLFDFSHTNSIVKHLLLPGIILMISCI